MIKNDLKITYYDTEEHALTKNDIWLRRVGDAWELKIPINSGQYQEIEGEEKIRQIFDVPPKNDFEKDIAEFGYASFFEKIIKLKNEQSFLDEKKELLEYLKTKKPDHYQVLAKLNIV